MVFLWGEGGNLVEIHEKIWILEGLKIRLCTLSFFAECIYGRKILMGWKAMDKLDVDLFYI